MRAKILLIAGSASLLLLGCSSPRGGENESVIEQPNATQEQSMVNTNEGVAPAPMNTPAAPGTAGRNPRDLRDPQAVTIPGPPMGPRP